MTTREQLETVLARLDLAPAGSAPQDGVRLREDLGIDSLGMVRLVRTLNEAFAIRIRASEMVPAHFTTVGQLVTFLEKKAAEAKA